MDDISPHPRVFVYVERSIVLRMYNKEVTHPLEIMRDMNDAASHERRPRVLWLELTSLPASPVTPVPSPHERLPLDPGRVKSGLSRQKPFLTLGWSKPKALGTLL